MATLKEHQTAMVDLLANGSGIPASASRLAHAMHDLIGIVMLQSAARENAVDINYAINALHDATTPGLNDKALSKREKTLKTDSPAKWPKAERFNVNIKLSDMDEVKTTLHNMQSHLDGARDSQRAAENRVKELENTIRQLKANNRALRQEVGALRNTLEFADGVTTEKQFMANNAKLKSQNEDLRDDIGAMASKLHTAEKQLGRGLRGVIEHQEQAGCRKGDTQVCEHELGGECRHGNKTEWVCVKCGAFVEEYL